MIQSNPPNPPLWISQVEWKHCSSSYQLITSITNLICLLILTSVICVCVCVCVCTWVSERERETDLQASLFSLPLSVLPDWLEVLEPVSVLVSCCCWCSGSSSRAFLRQMAANSILATGIAADWPSLSKHKNTQGLGWFWARGTSAVLVANYLSLSQCSVL